jgi:hypothetical protein
MFSGVQTSDFSLLFIYLFIHYLRMCSKFVKFIIAAAYALRRQLQNMFMKLKRHIPS